MSLEDYAEFRILDDAERFAMTAQDSSRDGSGGGLWIVAFCIVVGVPMLLASAWKRLFR